MIAFFYEHFLLILNAHLFTRTVRIGCTVVVRVHCCNIFICLFFFSFFLLQDFVILTNFKQIAQLSSIHVSSLALVLSITFAHFAVRSHFLFIHYL